MGVSGGALGGDLRAGAVLIWRVPCVPHPRGTGQGCWSQQGEHPGRFPHPRLLRGISLHKEKQISLSRASAGELTHADQAGKHWPENKTGALQPAPSSREPPPNHSGVSPLGSSKPLPVQPTAP